MSAKIQFTTHLNADSDTPIFKNGTAFAFKYQAVTSESESKVSGFSHFPKLREINSTEAYSFVAHTGHSDTLAERTTVKRSQTAASKNAHESLFNRMNDQLTVLDKENAETREERSRLVEIVTSFLPQQSTIVFNAGSQSPRAIGLVAAPSDPVGLSLGDAVKDAAFSALSKFVFYADKKDLEAKVNNLLPPQTVFRKL